MAKYRVIEEKEDVSYHIEMYDTSRGRWRSCNEHGNVYDYFLEEKNYYKQYDTVGEARMMARKFAIESAPGQWIKKYKGPGGTFWVWAKDDERAYVRQDLRFFKLLQDINKPDNVPVVNEAGVITSDYKYLNIFDAAAIAKRLASGELGKVIYNVESKDVIKLTLSDQRFE